MKKLVFILILTFGFAYTQAQEVYNSSGKPGYHKKTNKKKGYDPSKLIIGGGIDFNFGDGFIDAGIAPILGYRFTRNFEAGIGLGYQYDRQPDPYFGAVNTVYYDKQNIVYPSVWVRYFVWRNIYVTTQFEYDFINQKGPIDNWNDQGTANFNVPCLLIGPGFRQPISGRASGFLEIMYDALQQRNSPYLNNLVPRVGIALGL